MLNFFKIEVELVKAGDLESTWVVFSGSSLEEVEGDYEFAMEDRYCEFKQISYKQYSRKHEDELWCYI